MPPAAATATYTTADIRNILLCGHGGCGKTTLADEGAVLRITRRRGHTAAWTS